MNVTIELTTEQLRDKLRQSLDVYFEYASTHDIVRDRAFVAQAGGSNKAQFAISISIVKLDLIVRAVAAKQELHLSDDDLACDMFAIRSAYLEWDHVISTLIPNFWDDARYSSNPDDVGVFKLHKFFGA